MMFPNLGFAGMQQQPWQAMPQNMQLPDAGELAQMNVPLSATLRNVPRADILAGVPQGPNWRDRLGGIGAALGGGPMPTPTNTMGKLGAALSAGQQRPSLDPIPMPQGQPIAARPMSVPDLVALYQRNNMPLPQRPTIPGLLRR